MRMIKLSRRYLVLLVFIGFVSSVFSQKTIKTTAYLESVFKTSIVESDSTGLSFLENYNYNLPVIKSVGLRTESNDYLVNRQEYSMRVKPNSLKAISSQKKVFQNKIDEVKIENQLNFNNELKKRYLLILDYYFTREIIKIEEERQSQEKDKLKFLSKSIYDDDFEIKALLDSEEELLSIELKLANLKDTEDAQHYVLQQLLNFQGDTLIFDFDDLIPVEQIITQPHSFLVSEHVEITKQKLKLATLENEMALDKAKSNQVIDFFQAKFQSSSDINFSDNFSLGLGINLPFFGGNRTKKGDYYFKKMAEESELKVLQNQIDQELLFVQNEFKNTIMNYQVLNAQFMGSSAASILESYKKMDGVSPILLLKLMALQSKKELEVLQSKYNLYKMYIEISASEGSLFQPPLINHLSANKELIVSR